MIMDKRINIITRNESQMSYSEKVKYRKFFPVQFKGNVIFQEVQIDGNTLAVMFFLGEELHPYVILRPYAKSEEKIFLKEYRYRYLPLEVVLIEVDGITVKILDEKKEIIKLRY
jgi:hypothetical protein